MKPTIELIGTIERMEFLISIAHAGSINATVELWSLIANLESDHLRIVWIKRFTELINPQPAKVTTINALITKVKSA